MKTIEFTRREISLLQSFLTHLESKHDWVQVRDTDLFKCEVLLYKEELDFDIINGISKKLY
jgi:hypothetical protein